MAHSVWGYPNTIFRRRLIEEDGRKCYLHPDGRDDEFLARYGPCERGPDGGLDPHHLIPQQTLRRKWQEVGVPESVLISDYRNGILVCRRHHRLLDAHTGRPRLRLRLIDLPPRFIEFLSQFHLWPEAERIYVRPEGHASPDGADRPTYAD